MSLLLVMIIFSLANPPIHFPIWLWLLVFGGTLLRYFSEAEYAMKKFFIMKLLDDRKFVKKLREKLKPDPVIKTKYPGFSTFGMM